MGQNKMQALSPEIIEELFSLDESSGAVLKTWQIKAFAQPTFIIDAMMIGFLMMMGLMCAYGMFLTEDPHTKISLVEFSIINMAMTSFCWIVVFRQKDLYSYVITETGGKVRYWLHYPKYAGVVFKGLAVFTFILLFGMIALMPSMIFAIVGVGAATLAAALKLWGWENEVHGTSFQWSRAQLIFTDRKRNVVSIQRRYDPAIPFEENYMDCEVHLSSEAIDDFLDICRKYAPATVDFEEGKLL